MKGLTTFGGCCCPDCQVRTCSCCPCVCQALCVTLDVYAPDGCNCDHGSARLPYAAGEWAGYLACGDLLIDLRFFLSEDEYGVCRLCLTSACLGLDAVCVPIDNCERIGAEWQVDLSGCGGSCGGGVLSVACAPEITTKSCPDSPCQCQCLCALLWAPLPGGSTCLTSGRLCYDAYEDAWVGTLMCGGTAIPLRVELPEVSLRQCYWRVSSTCAAFPAGNESAAIPASFAVNLSGCAVGTPVGNGILAIRCEDCGGCNTSFCCDGAIPDTLRVELTTNCGSYGADLGFDATACGGAGGWRGAVTIRCACPFLNTEHVVDVLFCCWPTFVLSVTCRATGASNANPPTAGACEPFWQHFDAASFGCLGCSGTAVLY